MLWQCSWLWPLDDSDSELSWIIMNYHELSAIRSPRMSFRIVPQYDSAFIIHILHNSLRWTTLAPDSFLNQVAFLQILVPGSETLPTSANICLLNQPLLSKPLLVVAVDIHLTCASLTQSEGPRMGRQDSHSFVMLLFFVVMSYHVSDILLVRSVDAISSSLVCAKLTSNSLVHPTPTFTSQQVCISAAKISGNLFGSTGIQYQKCIKKQLWDLSETLDS